jgi:hypothetical protein
MGEFSITAGDKGKYPLYIRIRPQTSRRARTCIIPHYQGRKLIRLSGYVQNVSKLLGKVFEKDPVITYMLQSLSPEERLAYMPTYFNSLFTAAASNRATFLEANDWSSCVVLMPPGAKVDNPLTLIPSGLLGVFWMIGIAGCRVGCVLPTCKPAL